MSIVFILSIERQGSGDSAPCALYPGPPCSRLYYSLCRWSLLQSSRCRFHIISVIAAVMCNAKMAKRMISARGIFLFLRRANGATMSRIRNTGNVKIATAAFHARQLVIMSRLLIVCQSAVIIFLILERQRSPDGAPCATYGGTPCSALLLLSIRFGLVICSYDSVNNNSEGKTENVVCKKELIAEIK